MNDVGLTPKQRDRLFTFMIAACAMSLSSFIGAANDEAIATGSFSKESSPSGIPPIDVSFV
jgi:hypothetical protein